MRFSVEAWDPAYGSAVESLELEASTEAVDAAVEVALDRWAPVTTSGAVFPASIVFVDGVRRIDARVWIEHDGLSHPGVCATVAAGAVRTDGTGARLVQALVDRGLYAMGAGADDIVTRAGTYGLVVCASDTPEEIYLAIHKEMTALEQHVAAACGTDELLVVDGPLRGQSASNLVGYVKSQHVQYLPPEQQQLLGVLAAGERTPVFLIGGRRSRWSWYLRLPGRRVHPLSGIVRCEVAASAELPAVIVTASVVTAALQRFASEPHKDTRSPQNLYPIAGLETALRRRLGDALLVERALRLASLDTALPV